MQNLIEEMSNQELVFVIKNMGDYEEVADALEELKRRKEEKFVKITREIVEDKLGDVYLQARAFELIYSKDLKCAIEVLNKNIYDLDLYVIACAMDCLSEDSNIISLEIVREVVQKLLMKYNVGKTDNLSIGKNMKDSIEWFKNSYESKV